MFALTPLVAGTAFTQQFPAKPVRIVVPFARGGCPGSRRGGWFWGGDGARPPGWWHGVLLPLAIATFALTSLVAGAAFAQPYPAKPVRIVVPFAPGGPNDILARVIAQKLGESWGQSVIVENRGGGGTVIGTEHVARSAPDGYTLLMVSTSHTSNPSLRKLPYDPHRDLEPVILVASGPNVVLAHPSVPAKSVRELLALARARPGQVAFGSGGLGTSTHLSGEMLAMMGGVRMIHVPYKGAGPVTVDLLSGQITWMVGTILPSMPHVRSGRLRALAVTGKTRVPVLPDTPPVADTLPGFEASSWYGVAAPGGTPRELVNRLNQEIGKALGARDVRDRVESEGAEVIGGSAQEFASFYRAEIEKWAKVIKAAGIRLE